MMAPHGRSESRARGIRLDWDIFRQLLPYVWAYRGRTAVALVFLFAAKVATVAVPWVLKEIVDTLEGGAQVELVVPVGLVLGYGALRLASSAFEELRDATFARMRYGIMRRISEQVLEHLHDLSLRFHLDRKTGAVTRDIGRGTRSLSNLLNYLLFRIVPTLVEIGLVAGVLVTLYDPWFAVVVLLTFVVYVGLTLGMTEWRIRYRIEMNEAESQANSRAIDGLLNYETVKYFGNEDFELERYHDDLETWQDAAVHSQTTLSFLNIVQRSVIACGVTVVMLMAARGVAAGEMSVGDLVAVNAYLLQVFMPLGFLGTVYSILKHAVSDMERMFDLLDETPEVQDLPEADQLQVDAGRVSFQGVSFRYEEAKPVLREVSFDVPAGRKVAIVGPSGAGKSTIARLLFRFYDVDQGCITIDGQDISQVTQQSLRQAIGVVPQDTVLFNDTIAFNIRYGHLEATDEEIRRAAKVADVHDFVQSLPDGYETVVGERGLKLSGGEKQRVAIARAVLKDPPVMIFDEATSSLDSESEQAILSALKDASEDHTTIAIAHRLSTITDADEILVLRDGHIVERGTHADLLETPGLYRRMWQLQQSEAADGDGRRLAWEAFDEESNSEIDSDTGEN
jgi:ATP-binding cassette subfamily B protein